MQLSQAQVVALEVILRPLIPYLIPAIVLPWPLMELRRVQASVEGQKLRSQIRTTLCLTWAYIILNVPYAIVFIIHYVALLKEVSSSVGQKTNQTILLHIHSRILRRQWPFATFNGFSSWYTKLFSYWCLQ